MPPLKARPILLCLTCALAIPVKDSNAKDNFLAYLKSICHTSKAPENWTENLKTNSSAPIQLQTQIFTTVTFILKKKTCIKTNTHTKFRYTNPVEIRDINQTSQYRSQQYHNRSHSLRPSHTTIPNIEIIHSHTSTQHKSVPKPNQHHASSFQTDLFSTKTHTDVSHTHTDCNTHRGEEECDQIQIQ